MCPRVGSTRYGNHGFINLGTLGTRFGGIKPGADLDANTWTAAIRKADVLKGARFNESIALGAWGTEFHSAETMDSVFKLPGGNGVYEIPLGAVTSVDTANLFAAGRTADGDQMAGASLTRHGHGVRHGSGLRGCNGVAVAATASPAPARNIHGAEVPADRMR